MKIRNRVKEYKTVLGSELIPNPKNWRKHPDHQVSAMKALLAEIGFAGANLAYETDQGLKLIDGHLRAEIAPDQEIPVLVLDVNDEEADKILLTFDAITQVATPDLAQFDNLVSELEFESPDINELLASLSHDILPTSDDPPSVNESEGEPLPPLPKDPVVRKGDVWLLGDHRLMCGDSTDPESVSELMSGLCFDLLFTSPPYGQQRDYTEGISDWDMLMNRVFSNLPGKPDSQILVNLGLIHRESEWVRYWGDWFDFMRKEYRQFALYVWDQGSGLPGDWMGRLAPSFELVFHFNREIKRPNKWIEKKEESIQYRSEGSASLRNSKGEVEKVYSPELFMQTHKIPDSVIRVNRQSGRFDTDLEHPAVFSVAFAEFILKTYSSKGDVCYEPFCGSGTQIVAAENLGRRCFGMELAPEYADVCVQRWMKHTGEDAMLDGVSYSVVRSERLGDESKG